ncbi:DUF1684 domain-containing protein [Pseudotenacibaculum sp. MALMAid0570]|uniref:DUF1684 domain-containing protein n=1 Tax=Pseudotenacibaculum sp. MALMAid0570 TaxID=3143938 RepID=UPI0032DE5D34
MKKLLTFLVLFSIFACNSQDKRPIAGETDYQRELNAQYKDASRSPLKKKDLKKFKGLDFYPVDSAYVVTAKIKRTPNTSFIPMATTTDRKPYYREFGILSFTIQGKELSLTVYKSKEEYDDPKYKGYLFLPFTDDTSGDGSYGGGRYMDIYEHQIQDDDTIIINFNNTYNPYCAYNDRYSCPLTPRKNHLDVAIKAGVKDFKKK